MRQHVYGIALATVIAAFATGTIAVYGKAFSSATEVVLRTPRAGLQLGPRADVKVRGVLVGEVSAVTATPDGADLVLALDHPVDRASTASLRPKTLFGEKYVELTPPGRPTRPLREGETITAASAPVETGQVLDRLLPLLREIHPERLNAALTSLATALDNRGARIGGTLDQADGYLQTLAPHLPVLQRDLSLLADVVGQYGDAAPDLLRSLAHGAKLSDVLTANEAQLDRLGTGLTRTTGKLDRLLTENETGLAGLQHVWRPTLALAARHAVTVPCVFQGIERLQPRLDRAFAGGRLRAVIELVRPRPPYRPGRDEPQYADRRAPSCHGLPGRVPVPFPEPRFADGSRR
ncbi:MCE family protein [Nonomuraea sp. NPDC050310]|uniref:MCE family protein n=1 Tax=Nonomuraea sp. NPDC050310 TaxID=3154935 RepID=UPI0033CF7D83